MGAQVMFRGELAAVGGAEAIELSNLEFADSALLVFVASVEDVRQAAPLFRKVTRFYSGPVHDAAEELHAVVAELAGRVGHASGCTSRRRMPVGQEFECDCSLSRAIKVLEKARGP